MSFVVPSSSTPKRQTSMNAEQSLKDHTLKLTLTSTLASYPLIKPTQEMKSINLQSLTDPETVPRKLSRRATLRTCNQDRVEANAEESSKRLCFDKIRLLDPRHFHHMHYTTSPCKAIRTFTNRKPTSCDDDSIRSTPKAKRPQNLNYDPKRLLVP